MTRKLSLAVTVGGVLLVLLIWLVSTAVSNGNVESQRAGCMRGTTERLATARKDARDALRETVLAEAASGEVAQAHRDSAEEAERAAWEILSLTGVTAQTLDGILGLRADVPLVFQQRRAFCERNFPRRGPFARATEIAVLP